MRPILPTDSKTGQSIQILSYPPGNTGGAQIVVANALASTRSLSFSANCSVITVTSNGAFYFEVGSAPTANALSHYALGNFPYDIAVAAGASRPDANSIAVMSLAGNVAVYISERY